MIDLVIFDNDGVLVDSEPIACSVLADLLSELGLPTTFQDVVNEYLGGSIDRTRSIAESRLGLSLPVSFEAQFHERLFERLATELTPVPDVAWAIGELTVPYCVASSGTPERIRRSLSIAGLDSFFGDRVFSAAQIRHGKPAPDLFLFAASKMGVDPAACLVVEDSPLGIQAAETAGMRCLGYSSLMPPDRLAKARDGVLRSMKDLPSRIRQIEQVGL